MHEIEKIYYNMDRLIDDFVDLPETIKARDDFSEAVSDMILPERKMAFEDLVTGLSAANEKQGFLYGFRYAVSLLTSGNSSALKLE